MDLDMQHGVVMVLGQPRTMHKGTLIGSPLGAGASSIAVAWKEEKAKRRRTREVQSTLHKMMLRKRWLDDVLVICHGGPIAESEDARFIIENCQGVDGFYGASSMERLPVETALTAQVEKFCSLKFPSR